MEIKDALGRTIELSSPPQRIISLVPSYTQSLFEIGAGEKLVGRTQYCIHPAYAVKNIPVVGGTKQIKDLGFIQSLQPDLILCNKEENTPEIVANLEAICPVWVSEIKDLADNHSFLELLGILTHCEAKVIEINEVIEFEFNTLNNITKRYSALYLIWRKPFMAAASHTFIDFILNKGGFTNVLKAQERYPTLDTDEISKLQVDVVMLSSEPYPFKKKHIREIQQLLPHSKVLLVDGERFSWHGSGIIKTPEYIKRLLEQV